MDPWGWTWVDDAPWGFAVSHYGRWTNLRGTWGWVPGPVRTRAYYAPALVAFVGGDNFQLTISSGSVGGVGWFPLGPREVYRPSYPVSRGYFENVNRSNTIVNTTVINNYYNNTNVTNVVYANRSVPGAVVAVPTTAFVQSQPVSRAAVRVNREAYASVPVALVPALAPTERSVRGAAAQGGTPPPRVFDRTVVARTAPPAAPASFAAQQRQLEARPGKPLDDATRRQLRPDAAATSVPAVRVVEPTQKAPPTMRPPTAETAAKPAPGRSEPVSRESPESRGRPAAPPPSPQRAAEPRAAPPSAPPPQAAQRPPTGPPADQRAKPEGRGNVESRGQPAPPPPPPQRAAEPKVRPAGRHATPGGCAAADRATGGATREARGTRQRGTPRPSRRASSATAARGRAQGRTTKGGPSAAAGGSTACARCAATRAEGATAAGAPGRTARAADQAGRRQADREGQGRRGRKA